MGSHQLPEAILVPDDKLDCFGYGRKFGPDRNCLVFSPGLELPPRADGSPLPRRIKKGFSRTGFPPKSPALFPWCRTDRTDPGCRRRRSCGRLETYKTEGSCRFERSSSHLLAQAHLLKLQFKFYSRRGN